MKNYIILGIAFALTACHTPKQTTQQMPGMSKTEIIETNPLLMESTLPYGAPDFRLIKDEHYLPAMEKAMASQAETIQKIAVQEASPTFENTILAMEKSGKALSRVANVFYAMTSAHTNDKIKEVQGILSPKMAKHRDDIYLNDALFQRVKNVHENLSSLNLDAESTKLVEEYYKDFVQAGANLNSADKLKLKEINAEIATLQTAFNQTLQNANNAAKIVVKDKSRLAGLTESEIKAMENEDGKSWTVAILNTTQQPLLSKLKDRVLRKELHEASWNRTNGNDFDTNQTIVQLAQLRAEKADLLGYENYAQWNLVNTMVQNPETVKDFFTGMIQAIQKKTAAEAKDIEAMMHADGVEGDVKPWDWSYYAEKVRKAKYDLDESQIKPYFELKKVLENGVFFAANKLYGLTFQERKDIPTYHPDVMVYEVFDADGSPMALFYGDYFARESKRGGAWMSNFVDQSFLYHQKPVIYNVCNYQKPAQGEAALISYDDAETMFHEFGHGLHGLFANQKYPKLSGTAVARDFVEFPSQANEHWTLDPTVLKNYAKHYKTGEVIPDALIQKIKAASTFNQGFSMTEVMGAADLDLNWHSLSVEEAKAITNPNEFEKTALTKDGLWNTYVPPRYRSSFFAHIFGGGYAAGYYSYLWTEMLALDTGAWFEENGGLQRELGQRYRDMILSQGNTQEYKAMYKAFRGSDPQPEPMIKTRGLN